MYSLVPNSSVSLRTLILLFSCAVLCMGADESAPKPKRQSFRRHRVYQTVHMQGKAPTIDGKLDDACWSEQGVWTSDYEQLTPRYEDKATEKTDIKILYDEKNLYVAIRAHESDMSKISSFSGDRDEFTGDIVGVTVDSYHDYRSSFEFDLTAAGQKLDLKVYNNGWDSSWNAVWEGKVGREDKAWTAEFLIPLSQLRYTPGNSTWGLHSWRWIDRIKEESDWNLLANDDSGFVKSFGEIRGLDGLKSVRRIELVPYSSLKLETFGNHTGSADERSKTSFKGGLDAKIGLTSSLTLDASILPDFGQVESDPSVMNLSAYETFLEEKRTLFLEGKDIFQFPFENNQVFYSRRIGQAPSYYPSTLDSRMPESTTLLGAAKVSGKTANGWSLGLLACLTDEETAGVLNNGIHETMAVEPRTGYFVARAQKEFRDGDTTLGGIVTHTSREPANDALAAYKARQSTVAGLDFNHYWSGRQYYFKCIGLHSLIEGDSRAISRLQRSSARYYQRPIDGISRYDSSRDSLEGSGLLLEGGRASKGHWRYNERLVVKTPGLDFNDLGYLSTTDRITQRSTGSYVEKDPAAFYRSYKFSLTNTNDWTTHGEFLQSSTDFEAESEFSNKWEFYGDLSYTGPAHDPVALRGGPLLRTPQNLYWEGTLSTDGSRRVFGKAYVKGSHSGEDAYEMKTIGAKLSVRPIPSLSASLTVEKKSETDALHNVVMQSANGSPGYFVSRLEGKALSFALRAQWIIRPELRLLYYGNPFGSTIRQSSFRRVTNAEASSYSARFGQTLASSYRSGSLFFDENRDGQDDFWVADCDSNYSSFRSNLVLKWEFRRGSMLYFVWSQQREDSYVLASDTPVDSVSRLRRIAPNNQFMVKATYWFNL